MQLSEISGCVGEWRKGIVRVSERLGEAERDIQNRVSRRGGRRGEGSR